ncbi:hypothetical protein RhiirC2_857117 [Rhizophagus irregularis]|uniref:Uncharacterized protein n=1 Tax=Rhizophagus irregularis TaxID=588596 RepID=A0A2N1ME51_9GLOM|nr:hypothetical protein RhiirC2_857117 [Rhizophagus irregularis]
MQLQLITITFTQMNSQYLKYNGLAAAICHAYNKHQHLRLIPDDICFIQGVSQHINYNAEKFRYRNKPEAINRLVVATNEAVEKIENFKSIRICKKMDLKNNSIEPNDILDGSTEVLFMADTGFSLKLFTGF